jgi:GT2 family glycosyltransferase
MHPLNIPRLKRNDSLASMCHAAEHGTASIRSSSFVSMLISSDLVQRYGLPIADYFIWNDDVEYTARILRREFGVLVPQSVVVHKTAEKVSEPGWKFYYGLRNSLWMTRFSDAWSGREKAERLVATAHLTYEFLTQNFHLKKIPLVLRGLWHGLTRRPA